MKLKTFNSENTQSARENRPLLSIYVKSGVFTFNTSAAELIGFKDQSEIMLHQDEDEDDCWYVEVVKTNGFKIRCAGNNAKKQFHFNSTALAKALTNDGDLNGKFIVAGQPTKIESKKMFGLLRRAPKI